MPVTVLLDLIRASRFSAETRRALRVDVSVALLTTVATGLTNPFTGLILRRELGATPLQLSLLASANAACLLLSLLLVRLVDNRRPLPYVVWPGFIARGLLLTVPFIDAAWPFVLMLVAVTLLGTLASPAQTAVIEQLYPAGERGRALSAVRVVAAVMSIGLAAAAGQLMGWVSWRWVFAAAGIVGMAASLRQLWLPVREAPAAPPSRPAVGAALRILREDRDYRRVLIGAFVFGSGVWMQVPATPLVIADVVKATTAQVGVLAAAGAVAALGGNLLWGRLVDGRSSVATLRIVYLVGTLMPLLYFVAHAPWMLLAATVTEALLACGLDLVWTLVVIDCAGRRGTAQYAALAATLAGIRGVIAPLVTAALIPTLGVHAVFLVAAVLMAAGAWLVTRHVTVPVVAPRPALSH